MPSDKYLSVDSLNPTKVNGTTALLDIVRRGSSVMGGRGSSSGGGGSGGGVGAGGSPGRSPGSTLDLDDQDNGGGSGGSGGAGGLASDDVSLYNAALVADVVEGGGCEEGAFGSPSSLIFYLVPTDVTGDTLKVNGGDRVQW